MIITIIKFPMLMRHTKLNFSVIHLLVFLHLPYAHARCFQQSDFLNEKRELMFGAVEDLIEIRLLPRHLSHEVCILHYHHQYSDLPCISRM